MFKFKKVLFFLCWLPFLLQAKNEEKKPDWVFDSNKGCKKSELCASGVGPSLLQAKVNAREEIAKFFSNKVSSQFQTSLTARNNTIEEYATEYIQEETEEVLEGVIIKNTHEGEYEYFALAALNKNKASLIIGKKISELDKEISSLYQSEIISQIHRAENLFAKRSLLNQKNILLTGLDKTPTVSLAKLRKKKRALSKNIFIKIKTSDGNKPISQVLANSFHKMGLTMKEEHFTHLIEIQFNNSKEYLNVEGFEKYKFTTQIRARNRKGNITGSLHFSTFQTGRNFKQIKEQAIKEIEEYIDNHIEELKLN